MSGINTIYIYIYTCVCVCALANSKLLSISPPLCGLSFIYNLWQFSLSINPIRGSVGSLTPGAAGSPTKQWRGLLCVATSQPC